MAAALGNVDAARQLEDPLPRHDARRQVPESTGAWPSCTRQQAPETGPRARGVGSGLRSHPPDGLINQRNFGGHRYPRLAHVGDRTGLELIRTLQDHGSPPGHRLPHGVHRAPSWCGTKTAPDRRRGSLPLARDRQIGSCSSGPRAVILATGGGGKRLERVTSNSWEYTGDGAGARLQRRRRADGPRVHPVPPHRHGLAAIGARHAGDRRACAARAASCTNSEGERFMFRLRAQTALQVRDRRLHRGGRPVAEGRRGRDVGPRSCSPATWSPGPSSSRGARPDAALRKGGAFLDIATRRRPAEFDQAQAPVDVPPVQGTGGGRHHSTTPMQVGPNAPLLHGWRSGSRPTARQTNVPGLFACGECAAGLARRQPPRRQLPLRSGRLRSASPDSESQGLLVDGLSAKPHRGPTMGRSRPHSDDATDLAEPGDPATNPYLIHERASGGDATATSALSAIDDELANRHRARSRQLKKFVHENGQGARRPASTIPGWHEALVDRIRCLITAEAVARAGRTCARRAVAPTPASTTRASGTSGCAVQHHHPEGSDDGEHVKSSDEQRDEATSPDLAAIARAIHRRSRSRQGRRRPGSLSMSSRTFNVWRGDCGRRGLQSSTTEEVDEGMVVLDVLHQHPGPPGRRPRHPLELQGRQVRVLQHGDQRKARASPA